MADLYVGRLIKNKNETTKYIKQGPPALLRSMKQIRDIFELNKKEKIVVITDRFFSSVQGALELMDLGFYTVGTIKNNGFGLPENFITSKPLKNRGDYFLAHYKKDHRLCLIGWKDKKKIAFVSTGVSNKDDVVTRNIKIKGKYEKQLVSCPTSCARYNRKMGGVDKHDQLRLQYYSVQSVFRFKKWFKQTFVGLFDILLTNMFIAANGIQKTDHHDFLHKLGRAI
jgi:Transposase IS4